RRALPASATERCERFARRGNCMTARHRSLAPASLALLLLAPTAPAGATIPGNIEQRANSGLLHVCQDVEPEDTDDYFVCDEQPGGDDEAAYTGSECVAQSLPPVCVIDFIPKVRIKGRLLLVNADQAFDSFANSSAGASLIPDIQTGQR